VESKLSEEKVENHRKPALNIAQIVKESEDNGTIIYNIHIHMQ